MVLDEVTLSDHALITFSVRPVGTIHQQWKGAPRQAWDIKKLDHDMLLYHMNSLQITNGQAETMADELTKLLVATCDATMPRKKKAKRKPPVYWWSPSLHQLRTECFKARRRAQRARGAPHHAELLEVFKSKRAELKHGILAAKTRAFRDLLESVDDDPWGLAYKLVSKKLSRRESTPDDPEILSSIVSELFPMQTTLWQPRVESPASPFPEVTVREVVEAANRIKPNKAPGLDGIPGVVIKAVALGRPEMFRDTFQQCLLDGVFPKQWKRQKLVLLPKGKGPVGNCPLCMLDILGKFFERILYARLETTTESPNGLGRHQYGFRKGRSTLDALAAVENIARDALNGDRWLGGRKKYCAIVTLDVKNAFNTAKWPVILNAMRNMGIPEYLRITVGSYFRDRILCYDTAAGPKYYEVSSGVPQGSVLGPILCVCAETRRLKVGSISA